MNKKELRKYAIELRKSLTYNKDLLEEDLLKLVKDYKTIAIYNPLPYEIDVTFLKKYDFNLCYPHTFGYDMEFYMNPSKFSEGRFHVLEPLDGTLVDKKDIDIMIVPALVINSRNYRIGYGKGYYDKYLNNTNIKTIGICYKELFLDFLEENNDVKLGEILICRQ